MFSEWFVAGVSALIGLFLRSFGRSMVWPSGQSTNLPWMMPYPNANPDLAKKGYCWGGSCCFYRRPHWYSVQNRWKPSRWLYPHLNEACLVSETAIVTCYLHNWSHFAFASGLLFAALKGRKTTSFLLEVNTLRGLRIPFNCSVTLQEVRNGIRSHPFCWWLFGWPNLWFLHTSNWSWIGISVCGSVCVIWCHCLVCFQPIRSVIDWKKAYWLETECCSSCWDSFLSNQRSVSLSLSFFTPFYFHGKQK